MGALVVRLIAAAHCLTGTPTLNRNFSCMIMGQSDGPRRSDRSGRIVPADARMVQKKRRILIRRWSLCYGFKGRNWGMTLKRVSTTRRPPPSPACFWTGQTVDRSAWRQEGSAPQRMWRTRPAVKRRLMDRLGDDTKAAVSAWAAPRV